jgi:hypothetical protein
MSNYPVCSYLSIHLALTNLIRVVCYNHIGDCSRGGVP